MINLIPLDSTFSYYAPTFAVDGSGVDARTDPGTATLANVPCRYQPLASEVVEKFGQRREQRKADIFFQGVNVFGTIGFDGTIKIGGVDFNVTAKQNAGNQNSMFKLSIAEDLSGNATLP